MAQGPQAASAPATRVLKGVHHGRGLRVCMCNTALSGPVWVRVSVAQPAPVGGLQERGTTSPRTCSKGREAGLWHLSWSCCCHSLQALQGWVVGAGVQRGLW